VCEMPIIPGGLYALDIDDTLLKIRKIRNAEKESDNRKYKEVVSLQDERIPSYLQKVNAVATIIYITAREESSRQITQDQIMSLDLPQRPIFFSITKGVTLRDYCSSRTFTVVFFADDLDENIRDVIRDFPTAICYRIDPKLPGKISWRMSQTRISAGSPKQFPT
jgi:hypothetical protein